VRRNVIDLIVGPLENIHVEVIIVTRKLNPFISCLLAFTLVTVRPLSTSQALTMAAGGCYEEVVHAAQNENCAPCSSSWHCPGGSAVVCAAFSTCHTAPVNAPGKKCCDYHWEVIGHVYQCITNWDGTAITECVAELGLCAAACAVLGEICMECFIEVGSGCADQATQCGFVESCDKDTDNVQDSNRIIFEQLKGDACTGTG